MVMYSVIKLVIPKTSHSHSWNKKTDFGFVYDLMTCVFVEVYKI